MLCGVWCAVYGVWCMVCGVWCVVYVKAVLQYYIGEKKAPVLTIMIGGNHEASNYMWEL